MNKKVRLEGGEKVPAIAISVFFLLFYVFFQSSSIYGGDAGDLVTAAYVRGVAHPPGYPLYTFVGWLLTHLPLKTIAWRVGLLSTIPAAVSLGFVFLLLKRFTRNSLVSIIGTGTLGFSYLFWLYAIVPEVFALHFCFSVILLYLVQIYSDFGKLKHLHLAAFVLGLSMSHHHTIVFLIPTLLLIVYPRFKKVEQKGLVILKSIVGFVLGLTPYMYVWWAALANPPVNWEDPQTISGFLRLVSRAIYGTFRAGETFGLESLERYYQLLLFFETILIDFSRLGVALALIGGFFLFRRDRKTFWITLTSFIICGPLFIFYAGFPVLLNFHLATVERFLLLPYFFFVIWLSYGVLICGEKLSQLFSPILHRKKLVIFSTIFLIIPLLLFMTNVSKMAPLTNDQTAERLALDVLNSLPDNSILFPTDDTTFFNTQYMYFTQGGEEHWRGIKILQVGAIGFPFYNKLVTNLYPSLDLSGISPTDNVSTVIKTLADRYYPRFPIFIGSPVVVNENYGWVPVGLFYRLYKTEEIEKMSTSTFRQMNEDVFSKFQDPLAGALGVYTHVMLADVQRVYATARRDIGTKLVFANEIELAEKYFREAMRLQPEVAENRNSLVGALVLQKKCEEAKSLLADLPQSAYADKNTYKILSISAKECDQDEFKSQEYEKLYQERLKEGAIELDTF